MTDKPLFHQKKLTDDGCVILRVLAWHTECGECGYGRGGWASSPARQGNPPLTPDSRVCHGCGARFTHIESPYERKLTVLPQEAADAA